MGRRHVRVVEDLADLAVAPGTGTAPFGLNADHGIAVLHARDENPAPVDHGGRDAILLFSWRIAPGLAHAPLRLLGQFVEP